jgi:hypothetical protein
MNDLIFKNKVAEREEAAAGSEGMVRMSRLASLLEVNDVIYSRKEKKMESKSSGGIGCISIIGIVLIVLKLLAIEPVASWSWVWVLCPFWAPIAIIVVICVLVAFLISSK